MEFLSNIINEVNKAKKEHETENENATSNCDLVFKLPIEYTTKKRPVEKNIITDLELLETTETCNKSMYDVLPFHLKVNI